jgi:hypothetical protein
VRVRVALRSLNALIRQLRFLNPFVLRSKVPILGIFGGPYYLFLKRASG